MIEFFRQATVIQLDVHVHSHSFIFVYLYRVASKTRKVYIIPVAYEAEWTLYIADYTKLSKTRFVSSIDECILLYS